MIQSFLWWNGNSRFLAGKDSKLRVRGGLRNLYFMVPALNEVFNGFKIHRNVVAGNAAGIGIACAGRVYDFYVFHFFKFYLCDLMKQRYIELIYYPNF